MCGVSFPADGCWKGGREGGRGEHGTIEIQKTDFIVEALFGRGWDNGVQGLCGFIMDTQHSHYLSKDSRKELLEQMLP